MPTLFKSPHGFDIGCMNIEDPQRLWERLRLDAVDRVRDGFEPETVQGNRLHRCVALLEDPAFDDVIAWQIFAERGSDQGSPHAYHVTRTVWKQAFDYTRVSSPMGRPALLRLKHLRDLKPTLTFNQKVLDAGLIEPILSRLVAISVPLIEPETCTGVDG